MGTKKAGFIDVRAGYPSAPDQLASFSWNSSVEGSRRVLLVTRNFPPLVGGMERLIHHVYSALVTEFDVSLVGPRGCESYAAPGATVLSCPLSPTAAFLLFLHWNARRLAKTRRPDLVVAGSGVAAPAALHAARETGAPVACFLHGLDVVADSRIYRKLFIPAIKACDLLIANSRNTAALAERAGVDSRKLRILHPGVSMPTAKDRPPAGLFRKLVNGHGRTLLLSVGRIHPRKGLTEFVEKVLPALAVGRPDVLLAIIGEEPRRALRRSPGEKERIFRAVRSAGVETHVVFVGAVTEEVLAAAYAESDALVFPVLDLPGDVEGFGMVAVEAAAHGLPTVAFAAGGVADAVADNISGRLIPVGDYPGFTAALEKLLESKTTSWRERCVEHARAFAWDRFGRVLLHLCADLVSHRRG